MLFMIDDIFEIDAIDFYDYDAMEKLQERRNKKYMNIVRKWAAAKEKNDEKAKQRALKALSRHKKQDEVLKERSEQSGYYWY